MDTNPQTDFYMNSVHLHNHTDMRLITSTRIPQQSTNLHVNLNKPPDDSLRRDYISVLAQCLCTFCSSPLTRYWTAEDLIVCSCIINAHPLTISLLCVLLRAAHMRLCVLVAPLYSDQTSPFSFSLQRKGSLHGLLRGSPPAS